MGTLVMQSNVQTTGVAGSPEGPLARAVADECAAWCWGGGAWVLPSGGELLRIPMMPPLQRRPFPLLSQALSATPTPPPGLEAERLAQTAGRRARCLESLPWIPVVAPRIAC